MLQKRLHAIIPRLALLTGFCFFIEVVRIMITFNINYIFLPWNLILAWIPLWMAVRISEESHPGKQILYLLAWLLFFPNAPYIITDLLHLKPRDNFPFWYDSLLLFAYAFTGLTLGIFSALQVFKKLKALFTQWQARAFILMAMMISGYGIYLGRFLRYNSWDILSDPFQITGDTLNRLIHPMSYPRTYGVTLMAGILLMLVFSVFESFIPAE